VYGEEQTEKATEITAKLARHNPRRHVGYIVSILKRWRSEK
jgi:hypothetical protein